MPLCYRDRSYCNHEDCQNAGCDLLVTKKLKAEAGAFGLPLCTADLRQPDCGWLPPEGVER